VLLSAGMLSPPTGLGLDLDAQKTGLGLGLDGNGLGLGFELETLWPLPRVVWPRGLVYCNVLLISYSVADNCQFQLNICNCYCKVTYHENLLLYYYFCHLSLVLFESVIFTVSVISTCSFIVNSLWPRPRSIRTRPRPRPWPRPRPCDLGSWPRTLLASLTSLSIGATTSP